MRVKAWALRVAACLIAMMVAPVAGAQGPGAKGTSAAPPLSIAKQGYVFVGGHYNEDLEGKPMSGQLYAEYQFPQTLRHPYPIVMWHGGGQTGTNYTGTPDGREGWAQYFLRRGYAVYVIDQVGRGRAAYWTAVYGPSAGGGLDFIRKRFAAPEEFKLWPQAHLHTQWPGKAVPGDPAFDTFVATQVPGIASFAEQQKLNAAAGAALLDKIGPAILFTHSQSGAFGWPIADARPEAVKAIVALEPSGPPVHDVNFNGAPDWFSDDPHLKPYGLGEASLNYSKGSDGSDELKFVREDHAQSADLVRCWMQEEPARQLPHLAHLPLLILTGEASYHAPYDHCTVRYLEQAGVHSTYIKLVDRGIHGNGHMSMIEKNNLAIAAVIAEWLDKTLPATSAPAHVH